MVHNRKSSVTYEIGPRGSRVSAACNKDCIATIPATTAGFFHVVQVKGDRHEKTLSLKCNNICSLAELAANEAGALFVFVAVAIGELIGLAAKLSIIGATSKHCEKP
jgi:hypothetical protein